YCLLLAVLLDALRSAQFETLSLHDALPILSSVCLGQGTLLRDGAPLRGWWEFGLLRSREPVGTSGPSHQCGGIQGRRTSASSRRDRKSTRLNSSHDQISYAVSCLKKQK